MHAIVMLIKPGPWRVIGLANVVLARAEGWQLQQFQKVSGPSCPASFHSVNNDQMQAWHAKLLLHPSRS